MKRLLFLFLVALPLIGAAANAATNYTDAAIAAIPAWHFVTNHAAIVDLPAAALVRLYGSGDQTVYVDSSRTPANPLYRAACGWYQIIPPATPDSERVSALTLALAAAVTNRVAQEITIVVPAARAPAGGRQ